MAIIIPPIKSQGIKTKLVPWINNTVAQIGIDLDNATWIEPFFGTGVVGFNSITKEKRIVGDSNPHIISFYKGIQSGFINPQSVREYLCNEGELLKHANDNGYEHYRLVKDRFNQEHSPFDFLFLSRAGFNGMMRFNRKEEWNVPFCKKPNRFSRAYISKICNQIQAVQNVIEEYNWEFYCKDFVYTIQNAKHGDIIYCDPPYYGRYSDYYNGWREDNELQLFEALRKTKAYFVLSTWHHNEFRSNIMIDKYWNQFHILTQEHFYYNGGHVENRHPMTEALICNF